MATNPYSYMKAWRRKKRAEGWSWQRIMKGDRTGQHKRYKAKVIALGKKWSRGRRTEQYKRWALKNPLKYKAKRKVEYAVKVDKLIKPTICSVCGSVCKYIHGHHSDYSKPYDVLWLCIHCHNNLHKGGDTNGGN